ncbi:MAG TPA: universal stress protein, partial [Blastocatellia bacterium]
MKILIGYDGSSYADAAIDHLRRAGLPRSADVMVVSVASRSLISPPPWSHKLAEAMREEKSDSDSQFSGADDKEERAPLA